MISKRVLFIALALLAVSATSAMAAEVDITNHVIVNTLDIDSSSKAVLNGIGTYAIDNADTYTKIYNFVATGFNGGAWDGNGGIVSPQAAADASTYSVGILDNAQVGYSTFMGHAVTSNSRLVLTTLIGDISLDGVVDGTDYDLMYSNFGQSGKDWLGGDLTYDGIVDGTDYDLLYANFGRSITLLGDPPGAAAGAVVSANTVPEPSTILLLSVFGISALVFSFKRKS